MEKDQSEIEARCGLGNDSAQEQMRTIHKREREEQEHTSDLNVEIVLPFAKTSTKWELYESMDTPQRPHFAPLVKLPDILREKFALVCMEAFFDMYVKVHNHFPISRVQLESYKKAVVELEEEYGFNVKDTSSRIDELLSLKDEQPDVLEEEKGFTKEMTGESSSKGPKRFHITLVRCNSKSPL